MSLLTRTRFANGRVAALAAFVAVAADPYSYGDLGGEVLGRAEWQYFVAAVLLGFLFVIAWNASTDARVRDYRAMVTIEVLTWSCFNAALLLRDGPSRFFWGYAHAPLGFACVLVGLLAHLKLWSVSQAVGSPNA